MNVLNLIVIQPIEVMLEFFYVFLQRLILNKGLAIIGLSVLVNLIILPLYNAAERLQKKERDIRLSLTPGIQRIKETFSGDERFLILRTYYRQNKYHPLYELRGSLSVLLQVPFFIAAYQFLSNLIDLRGYRFFLISDLGLPDGMLILGGVAINALPILMTIVNLISGFFYTHGLAKRDAVQVYLLAGLFLILLYNSPSALVLYWTCNNIFSLTKNILQRLKRQRLVLYLLASITALLVAFIASRLHPDLSLAKRAVLAGGVLSVIVSPLIFRILSRVGKYFIEDRKLGEKREASIFFLSMGTLFLLHGLFVPSSLISSSTHDFAFTGVIENPLAYIVHTAAFFFGIYGVWLVIIYLFSNRKTKIFLAIVGASVASISLVNVLFFPIGSTILSIFLQFDDLSMLIPSHLTVALSLSLLIVIPFLIFLLLKRGKTHILVPVLVIASIGTLSASSYQMYVINNEYSLHRDTMTKYDSNSNSNEINPIFSLSREGQNVLFIFLDKATNHFLPLILEEVPELEAQLNGFVYYPNVISFGDDTIHGSPAMVGGYEYTPEAINKRPNERLVDKHNEALLVLPKLFLDNEYEVIITDPPYSNYRGGADFTPFKDYTDMQLVYMGNKFLANYKKENADVLTDKSSDDSNLIKKRLPIYSILRTMTPVFRHFLYANGSYFQVEEVQGYSLDSFISSYSQLYYLSELTQISDTGYYYNFISNHTPHLPFMLQTPEFEPRTVVTESKIFLDSQLGIREIDRLNYYSNVAALKRIGIWFDYLREHGVYDNTKIIIVADHGSPIYSPRLKDFGPKRYAYNAFVPLLLYKDFNVKGPIQTDETFMTHADTPYLLTQGIIDDPRNPFTGNTLNETRKKDTVNLFIGPWNPQDNQGNVFDFRLNDSFTLVNQNIFDENNWKPYQQTE